MIDRARIALAIGAVVLAVALLPAPARANCRGARLCREAAPSGSLNLDRSRGIWTTQCGPNTVVGGNDPICQDIVGCARAGSFSKFLAAVTTTCHEKTFDGYFGLDGLPPLAGRLARAGRGDQPHLRQPCRQERALPRGRSERGRRLLAPLGLGLGRPSAGGQAVEPEDAGQDTLTGARLAACSRAVDATRAPIRN
jgi:hypothetical protein